MNDFPLGFQPPPDDGDDDETPGGREDGPQSGGGVPPAADNPLAGLMGGFDPATLGAAFQQLGQMLSSSSGGPVDWGLARNTARQAVAAAGDPSLVEAQRTAAADALRLAELWLDPATALPQGAFTTAAWSRSEWIEQTLPAWESLVGPLAEKVAAASSQAIPEEVRAMAGPFLGMMAQLSGAMFGLQLGQGLAALAGEVLGSSDIGLPMAPDGVAALVPSNIETFGEGLGVPADQVRLYVALREAAHQRLFHHAPWLRARIAGAVEEYARGITVDVGAIEESVRGIDPSDPAAVQQLMQSGMFEPPTTPEQQQALDRIETLLALVEGWVDTVVDAASEPHLPAASALRETVRRRRASGGPAEATFATLVGLELRPRRLRDAAALWRRLQDSQGTAGRDAVWDHPDLLPTAEDLDDPAAFVERVAGGGTLDLSELDRLDGPSDESGEGTDERP